MEPKFLLLWDEVLETLSIWRSATVGDVEGGDRAREGREKEVLARLTGLTLSLASETLGRAGSGVGMSTGGGILGAIGLAIGLRKQSQFSSELVYVYFMF